MDYFPAFGQQEPLMFFFWKHQNFYLPSETGGENSFDGFISAKENLTGFNGHPQTMRMNYAQRLKKINSGLGFIGELDKIGFNQSQMAGVSYAYHWSISETKRLSFGSNIAFNNLLIKSNWITPTPEPDPSLPEQQTQQDLFVGFSASYASKNLFLGIGITRCSIFRSSQVITFNHVPQYYFTTGYKITFSDYCYLHPRFLIHTDLVKMLGTFQLQFRANKWLEFGTYMRTSKSFGANVMTHFKERFFIGYQGGVFRFLSNNNYEHELILGFQLK